MKFAFLVHPRSLNDVFRKYPLLKFFPKRLVKIFLKWRSPIIVSKIHGLPSLGADLVSDGLLISIGMTAKDMLADKESAKQEVIKAIHFAKKHGAELIGLGALTSPVVAGGVDVVGKYGVNITNGNTLTTAMAMEGIKKTIVGKYHLSLDSKFVVVGATGSIGSAVSKLLIESGITRNLVVLGRTPERVLSLRDTIFSNYTPQVPGLVVENSTDINSIKDADVVIVTTSADGALIKADLLKENAIVYDITQPRNTSESLKHERPDVLVVEGGLVSLPEGAGYRFNSGLPQGVAFSCLAETMVLASENLHTDFSVGVVDIKNVATISDLAHKRKILPAPLIVWGEII